MGGKSKQRVKNNARPSNSSRSAELVGSTGFVGFAAHAELGMVPLLPGFSTLESVPESFDANISTDYQLVFRKMTKKDPMTKKKALQEFVDLVNKHSLEENKVVLPLWPRFYQNLATDPEHAVRELAQSALRTLVSKCKRAVAPYLKQLVPHWLISQFDNYAPAASIATQSFRETFAGNVDRTQEVLLHCQTEIVEKAERNLTFHTASTLSSGKDIEPEEAEQKYQRTVIGSMKMLSFFVEKTRDLTENAEKLCSLSSIVEKQKFWSFAASKTPQIRAAWFELMFQLLQSSHYKILLTPVKDKVITLSFQNIDQTDASTASFAWGCVLLIQENYDDWHKSVKLQEVILPKVYNLLRNGLNRNASIIGPNLLPFFSKIPPQIFTENNYTEFIRVFFSELKQSITIENPYSMTELNAIIRSNFECLRYLSQKLNHITERSSEQESLAFWLVKENLIPSIIWFLESKCTSVKCYFQETSALVAFWAINCDKTNKNVLYLELLKTFWICISEYIIATIKNSDVSETYLDHLSVLLQDLCTANPNFEKHKIKFSDEDEPQASNAKQYSNTDCRDICKNGKSLKIIEKDLKSLSSELGKLCMQVCHERESIKYIKLIRQLTQLFSDIDFFKSLSTAETTTATLDAFKSLFENEHQNEETYELLVNIIFEILQNLQPNESFTYIRTNLLKNSRKSVKILVLQRLLSYPFCNEAAVREIIAQPEISSLIIEIAREAISDNTREKFNMLHKCFFQAETGEILINQTTVDGILKIFCEASFEAEQKDIIDACGSFLAQIMPVFCSGNNASEKVKNDVFLCLFEITMKHLESNEYISEDTLWEITTCWQDTLSSGDISMDKNLLQACCLVVDKYVHSENLKPTLVDNMADSLSKLIMCSTEHIKLKKDRLIEIDVIITSLFDSKEMKPEMISNFEDLCNILEATKCLCSAGSESLNENCLKSVDMLPIYKRTLLNLTTLKKLICKAAPRTEPTEEECSEDYCDINENLLTEWSDLSLRKIIEYLSIAAIGDSIVNNNLYPLTQLTEEFVLTLSETVKFIMSNDCDIISTLTEKLIEKASNEKIVRYSRIIPFLVYRPDYARFEESSTIVLEETLCNHFIEQSSFGTYVCCLQYLLPNLSPKAITMQNPIMQCDPSDVWIKAAMFRCLITNNFDNVSSNETKDKTIALAAFRFITDVVERNQNNKEFLLYNTTVHGKQFCNVVNIVEYINLFGELIEKFPYEMSLKNWDALRLGISSWTLSVSKSLKHFSNPAAFLFIARVFTLYEKLKKFIIIEKQKSSTTTITNVIEEWENLFARDVDLVLYKAFYTLCDKYGNSIDPGCYSLLMDQIVPAVELIDYSFIYRANKELNRLDYLCNFLLRHLSNPFHSIRTCCAHILNRMTPYFVAEDILNLEKGTEAFAGLNQNPVLHFLNYFSDYITRYSMPICSYLKEFSFKLPEINEFSPIDCNEAMSYLLLWNCIIHVCSNAPVSLRSIYTSWLHENRYEENFLHFLFRAMPTDILKNHDSKLMSSDIFKSLDYSQIKDPNIPVEKFACHMYTEILRKLPALVRKWWNACPSRQKTFVDKLTTNFVSSIICYEELKTIANRKEKHENMQVTVHNSTREVLAVYSIDDARMELVITLPPNCPLGAVKVECGKQIGGRSSSRNIGMQLSIFLTHQNGTICDGLTLWKDNLDKKFEGVEECYICYTVIHQDTCQLPKLSCKTCKKKFHGPCLYKWFTTSSKSTCPICRNVF